MKRLLPALLLLIAACQLDLPGQGDGASGADPAAESQNIGPAAADKAPRRRPDAGKVQALPAPMPASDDIDPAKVEAIVKAEQAAADKAAAAATAAAEIDLPEAAPAVPEVEKTPAQRACERKKGTWAIAAKGGARTCVLPTRDGGKACRKEGDCQGSCLARSMTCAPINPLFGCNEVLQGDGRRVTLCID